MRKLYFLIIFCFFTNNIFSQISNLDTYIQGQMETKHIPGLAACVVKKGEVVWSGAYGFANLSEQIPVSDETFFTIASLSKLFVGTAVMQLHENFLIDLDENINLYLPFDVINPNFPFEKITLRMLLQHRSSIVESENELYTFMTNDDSPMQLGYYLENLLTPDGEYYNPIFFSSSNEPGAATWYSNFGFSLAAYIVEQVSGISYSDYVKQNILDILCMENSSFFFSEISTENIAMPYYYSGGEYQPYGYYGIPAYPSALLKTNIKELSNFLIAYTQRGFMDGHLIINEQSANLLTPYSFEEENLAWWNGLYWRYTFHFPNDEVWYHGGYMHGIRTRINYYPNDSTGLIILTNGEGQYAGIEDTLLHYISEFEHSTPATLPCYSIETEQINKENNIIIYPNPLISGKAEVEFNISEFGFYQIKILNQFGEIVELILSSELKKGNYKVKFKLQNIQYGVYHIVLTGNNIVKSSKIIFLN